MTRYVVLLRGVNVGAHNRLSMANFRTVLTGCGCSDVATYLQSGNAVVDVDVRPDVRTEPSVRLPPDPAPPRGLRPDSGVDGLGARVEQALRDGPGLDVRVLIRTADELADVVAANPFPDRVDQPKRLHVVFLGGTPRRQELNALGPVHGSDELRAGDRVLYLSYAGGSQKSPLEKVLRRLDVVQTARNWTTVTALLDLARRP